ncbi:Benzoylformate decarboxylase [Psilocybe cubensis]|uniref:Benzoylformate decarboxylase n=2 Tax=Psilocybe cubensis TaxID=181762 RepID=A0ACB8GX88_PSICU|nr:Benzoylformate decarboxylase [Psilocybe cubensis]KAH9480074.1 Benzoylformate decarboxylase [Psilocybe cubensis]
MDSRPPSTYTGSSLLLRTLARAGITHAFVNWGSDHPALLEDLARQRVEDEGGETQPKIVTCPNEMVALSAAQGFAQVTGKPAAVIIHVDVGTQALAGAVHNVDRSRTPVLIFAGASPFSSNGEHKGTRNEWIMWLQDIPDQSAIVRQYMRHTAQLGSAKTIEQSVKRALQIATSEPKGPVYLWARREVMEEEVNPESLDHISGISKWPSIEPTSLTPSALKKISEALLTASSPLIITSHAGRSPAAVAALSSLATLLAIPVISTCPSTVNIPFSHPSYIGNTWLFPLTHWEKLQGVDVILVLECDLAWIPVNEKPVDDARVFVIDGGDPLKLGIGQWHVDAELVCRAEPAIALEQIEHSLRTMGVRPQGEAWCLGDYFADSSLEEKTRFRWETLRKNHDRLVSQLDSEEDKFRLVGKPSLPGEKQNPIVVMNVPNLIGVIRKTVAALTPSKGANTLFLNESISNFAPVWTHLRPEFPGSVITSGGSSLGWGLGAAIGASIGARTLGPMSNASSGGKEYDLIVYIVGDGSFMFGVPSSAYWMARKYNTPFLTIILNNGGWGSPMLSMLGVHPAGHGRNTLSGDKLTVGFGPNPPDYPQIAAAASAGWAWGARVGDVVTNSPKDTLTSTIDKAIKIVLEEKRCAVVDCILESI